MATTLQPYGCKNSDYHISSLLLCLVHLGTKNVFNFFVLLYLSEKYFRYLQKNILEENKYQPENIIFYFFPPV